VILTFSSAGASLTTGITGPFTCAAAAAASSLLACERKGGDVGGEPGSLGTAGALVGRPAPLCTRTRDLQPKRGLHAVFRRTG
jgi:hypothetical protein